jgi:hypothetical protein
MLLLRLLAGEGEGALLETEATLSLRAERRQHKLELF